MRSTFPPLRGSANTSRRSPAAVAAREPFEPRRVAWTTVRLDDLDEDVSEDSVAIGFWNEPPTGKDAFAASDGLGWARTRRRPPPVPPTPPPGYSERAGGSAGAYLGSRGGSEFDNNAGLVGVGAAGSSSRGRASSGSGNNPSARSRSPRLPAISPIRARAAKTARQASLTPSDAAKEKRNPPPGKASKKAKLLQGSAPAANNNATSSNHCSRYADNGGAAYAAGTLLPLDALPLATASVRDPKHAREPAGRRALRVLLGLEQRAGAHVGSA